MQNFRRQTYKIHLYNSITFYQSVYLEIYSSDNTDCFYLDTKIRSSTSLFWQKDQKWNEIRWVKIWQYLYTHSGWKGVLNWIWRKCLVFCFWGLFLMALLMLLLKPSWWSFQKTTLWLWNSSQILPHEGRENYSIEWWKLQI